MRTIITFIMANIYIYIYIYIYNGEIYWGIDISWYIMINHHRYDSWVRRTMMPWVVDSRMLLPGFNCIWYFHLGSLSGSDQLKHDHDPVFSIRYPSFPFAKQHQNHQNHHNNHNNHPPLTPPTPPTSNSDSNSNNNKQQQSRQPHRHHQQQT